MSGCREKQNPQFLIQEQFHNRNLDQEQEVAKVAPDEENLNKDRVSTPKVGNLDVDYLLRKWLP
ncbi:MAG: hypothetical protein JOZ78_11025 [Chroococcidiopsidaceae cyanobacterium CP_BM_ER_R8_30]|nr:hypothetical protein [Chroococcidiopsidaceae cyanobacterium CP_BM_ER_R8_30]